MDYDIIRDNKNNPHNNSGRKYTDVPKWKLGQ